MTENIHNGTIGHKLGSESAHVQLRRTVDEGHRELCGRVDGDEREVCRK